MSSRFESADCWLLTKASLCKCGRTTGKRNIWGKNYNNITKVCKNRAVIVDKLKNRCLYVLLFKLTFISKSWLSIWTDSSKGFYYFCVQRVLVLILGIFQERGQLHFDSFQKLKRKYNL